MSNIAFIPVRGGSKSIPHKNIKIICGKPLLYWATKALQESSTIDAIIVSTDCNEIEKTVLSFNFNKVSIFKRGAVNATDNASTESAIVEYISSSKLNDTDLLFLVQATNPFILSSDINLALKLMLEKSADSLLTCCRIKRFFWNEDGTPKNYNYKNRPRRQDFSGELIENGAFYINSVGNIKKEGNRLSGRVCIYEMKEHSCFEIDEPDDWIIVEELMKKHVVPFANNEKSKKIKLVATDVDGVLTDCGMYYSESGDEMKKFNTYDGMAFQLLRENGIETAIITSENTDIVARRANKLKVNYVYQGIKDKLQIAREICEKLGITLEEMAYIGDDINDIELLKTVGVCACPTSAQEDVKLIKNIIVLDSVGGNGVLRELVNQILKK